MSYWRRTRRATLWARAGARRNDSPAAQRWLSERTSWDDDIAKCWLDLNAASPRKIHASSWPELQRVSRHGVSQCPERAQSPAHCDPQKNPGNKTRRPANVLLVSTAATREEMSAARLPIQYRDSCAHLLIPLNRCRVQEYYLPWKCEVRNCATLQRTTMRY